MSEDLLHWRVNTPALLKETLQNKGSEALAIPLQIFGHLLHEVATRASQLNDPQLNNLMCRLSLYEVCDPYSPQFNAEVVKRLQQAAEKQA